MSQILQATDQPTPTQQGEDIDFDKFIEGLTPEKMASFVADMIALRKSRQGNNDGNT